MFDNILFLNILLSNIVLKVKTVSVHFNGYRSTSYQLLNKNKTGTNTIAMFSHNFQFTSLSVHFDLFSSHIVTQVLSQHN